VFSQRKYARTNTTKKLDKLAIEKWMSLKKIALLQGIALIVQVANPVAANILLASVSISLVEFRLRGMRFLPPLPHSKETFL